MVPSPETGKYNLKNLVRDAYCPQTPQAAKKILLILAPYQLVSSNPFTCSVPAEQDDLQHAIPVEVQGCSHPRYPRCPKLDALGEEIPPNEAGHHPYRVGTGPERQEDEAGFLT
jgi:hypothetical protein